MHWEISNNYKILSRLLVNQKDFIQRGKVKFFLSFVMVLDHEKKDILPHSSLPTTAYRLRIFELRS